MALNEKKYVDKVTDNIKSILCNFHHNQTGESIDEDEIEYIIREIMSGRLDLEDKELEIIIDKNKLYKYIDDKRRFLRVLITNYNNLDIGFKLEGILSRFSKNLRHDGSGIVDINNMYSISSLAKYFEIRPQTLSKMLKELEDKNAIKTEKIKQNTYIYLNPDIIRYGNIITEKLKTLFSISDEYLKVLND